MLLAELAIFVAVPTVRPGCSKGTSVGGRAGRAGLLARMLEKAACCRFAIWAAAV
jgi:hypothetical protein